MLSPEDVVMVGVVSSEHPANEEWELSQNVPLGPYGMTTTLPTQKNVYEVSHGSRTPQILFNNTF